MSHLPDHHQYAAELRATMRPVLPEPTSQSPCLVLPVLGALSGGTVAVLVALLVGPHLLELAIPLCGAAFGALLMGEAN